METKEKGMKTWSFTENKKVIDYTNQTFGMSCCAKESTKEKNKKENLEKKRKEVVPVNSEIMKKPPVDREVENKFYNNFNKPEAKNKPNKTMEKHNYILNAIKNNNHTFNGCMDCSIVINYKYTILVSCPEHKKSYETTSTNYLRNTKGLPCCSKESGKIKTRTSINKLFKELSEFINSSE